MPTVKHDLTLPAWEHPDLPRMNCVITQMGDTPDLPGVTVTFWDETGEFVGALYLEQRVHPEYGRTVYVDVHGAAGFGGDPLVMIDLKNERILRFNDRPIESGTR